MTKQEQIEKLKEILWESPCADLSLKVYDAGFRYVDKNDMQPKIVCLCGSTKFKQQFIDANFKETMKGNIVLTVGWFSHSDGNVFYPTEQEKIALDELHKRKIDLADEILVINVGGYIGDSTKSEINYTMAHDKPVRYLESPKPQ